MSAEPKPLISPRIRNIDGLAIRYAESDERDVDALLFCPWPESLFAFEQMWDELAESAHLVAVDLPGFGHSEGRESLMSPQAMGEFIVRVADAFGLEQPHAVGPDVGTAALLFAAASQPGRLRSLVVGTGGTAVPIQLGSPLKDWVEVPSLDAYREMDPRVIVGVALDTIQGHTLPDSVREDYLSAYDGDRFVKSMEYVRTYPIELPILAALLPAIQTPVQVISGAHDRVVPPVNAEFLHARLPKSKLDIVDSGHFVWEEAPREYADLIISWWAGGYMTI